MKSKSIYKDEDEAAPEQIQIALSPKFAARALSISEKTLWNISTPRGSLPCVRMGKSRISYFVHQIQAWADRELVRQQRGTDPSISRGEKAA